MGTIRGSAFAWLRNAARAARDQRSASRRWLQRMSGRGFTVNVRATGRNDTETAPVNCPSTIVAESARTGSDKPRTQATALMIARRNIRMDVPDFSIRIKTKCHSGRPTRDFPPAPAMATAGESGRLPMPADYRDEIVLPPELRHVLGE